MTTILQDKDDSRSRALKKKRFQITKHSKWPPPNNLRATTQRKEASEFDGLSSKHPYHFPSLISWTSKHRNQTGRTRHRRRQISHLHDSASYARTLCESSQKTRKNCTLQQPSMSIPIKGRNQGRGSKYIASLIRGRESTSLRPTIQQWDRT